MSTSKITRMALLVAIALVVFIIEARIPILLPIPGVKLGLANVVTLYAIFTLGRKEAFCILISRIILGSIFSGRVTTFLYSLVGGMICYIIMSLIKNRVNNKQIWICSILGAMGHSCGQIFMAVILTNTVEVMFYLPILLIISIIAGAITGVIAQSIMTRLSKITRLQKYI